MTGQELKYLLERTGITGKDFAEKMSINPSSITNYKKTKQFRPITEEYIFEAFAFYGFSSDQIRELLKQRFETEKKTPVTLADAALIRLTDLQSENNQLKRHIEALELNVKLLQQQLKSE